MGDDHRPCRTSRSSFSKSETMFRRHKKLCRIPQSVSCIAVREKNEHLLIVALPDLTSGKTSLVEVVQSLGPFINDEEASIRSRAVQYLSEVVGDLSDSFLTRQQTQVICQFLCDRIEDGGALPGLSRLQRCDKYTAAMATMTFRA